MIWWWVLFFNIIIIDQQLNRNFWNICNWFVDKLSIYFGEDKTKSILFAPLNKCKKLLKLNISYRSLKIKQCLEEVTYLSCIETNLRRVNGTNIVSKINIYLIFFHQKNKFLPPQLRWLLCNALIQPHFNYACSAGTPTSIKKSKQSYKLFKTKVYICFYLQLDNKACVGITEFK